MRFSTGIFDWLFGKKATVEVPSDSGGTRSVKVTQAWLRKMEAEGKISRAEQGNDSVPMHIVGPDGVSHCQVSIGTDIPADVYQRLKDAKTGHLYAIMVYESGIPKTTCLSKEKWDQAKRMMDSV